MPLFVRPVRDIVKAFNLRRGCQSGIAPRVAFGPFLPDDKILLCQNSLLFPIMPKDCRSLYGSPFQFTSLLTGSRIFLCKILQPDELCKVAHQLIQVVRIGRAVMRHIGICLALIGIFAFGKRLVVTDDTRKQHGILDIHFAVIVDITPPAVADVAPGRGRGRLAQLLLQ